MKKKEKNNKNNKSFDAIEVAVMLIPHNKPVDILISQINCSDNTFDDV